MQSFAAYRLFAGEGGGPPVGRFVTMSEDDLSAGDVLVRVAFTSVNYKDALAAAGINKIIRDYPRIGGIDLTGTVAKSKDPRFREGDHVVVHGFGLGVDRDGGYAQYARVEGDMVLPLPKGLSLLDCAVLGVDGTQRAQAWNRPDPCDGRDGRGRQRGHRYPVWARLRRRRHDWKIGLTRFLAVPRRKRGRGRRSRGCERSANRICALGGSRGFGGW
jgi:hypothetical protein